jgi:hypothetical protein
MRPYRLAVHGGSGFALAVVHHVQSRGMSMDDCDILWGAPAIAAAIGKSTRATYHLLEHGRLPAKKIGGQWVMSRAAFMLQLSCIEPAGVE